MDLRSFRCLAVKSIRMMGLIQIDFNINSISSVDFRKALVPIFVVAYTRRVFPSNRGGV